VKVVAERKRRCLGFEDACDGGASGGGGSKLWVVYDDSVIILQPERW